MIITFVLVVGALLALFFLIRLAKGRGFSALAASDTKVQIRPVDVRAFRNLIDPLEEDYLRRHLSRAEFAAIHRERLRAAITYIACAAHNAAVLMRVGEAARLSAEPSIAEAGEKLVDSALRLRLFALQATAKLYIGILLPGMRVSALSLADSYERMTGLGFLLGRLQSSERNPPLAV
jgi:hypothetical protein